MSTHRKGCLCSDCTHEREIISTRFAARDFVDVADPVLLAGWRAKRIRCARSRAQVELARRHPEEFAAIHAAEVAIENVRLDEIIARRRAAKSAGESLGKRHLITSDPRAGVGAGQGSELQRALPGAAPQEARAS